MGKGIHGNFRYTVGHGDHTIADNLPDVEKHFPLSPSGMFGKKGHGARVIETNSPVSTAYELFNRLVEGYDTIEPRSQRTAQVQEFWAIMCYVLFGINMLTS